MYLRSKSARVVSLHSNAGWHTRCSGRRRRVLRNDADEESKEHEDIKERTHDENAYDSAEMDSDVSWYDAGNFSRIWKGTMSIVPSNISPSMDSMKANHVGL